jgi:hypothetical protein
MRVFFIFTQVFVKFGFNFRVPIEFQKLNVALTSGGATMVASRRKIILSSIFVLFRAGLGIKSSFYLIVI